MLIGLFLYLLLFNSIFNSIYQKPIPVARASEFKISTYFKKGQDINNKNSNLKLSNSIIYPVRRKDTTSLGIKITADFAIVVDAKTQKILFSKNIDQKTPIASITKLMTALVFLDTKPDFSKVITMKKEDEMREGTFHVFRGEKLKTKDLLNIALIASDNNAIMALVRSTGLGVSKFVQLMNKKASDLGMSNTHFVEPTGLDHRNVSTARDLSILLAEVYKHKLLQNITSKSRYTFQIINSSKRRTIKNTNILLSGILNRWPFSFKVSKTGYITESGYNLASYIHNSDNNGDIIVVVLSSKTHFARFSDLKSLALWAFANFVWR